MPTGHMENITKAHARNIPETSYIHKSPIKDKIFKSYVEDGALIKTNEHDPRLLADVPEVPSAGVSTNFGVMPDPPKIVPPPNYSIQALLRRGSDQGGSQSNLQLSHDNL